MPDLIKMLTKKLIMLKQFFAVIMVAALLTACGSKKAAFQFSEDIVKKERSLISDIEKTEDAVERYNTAEQFDSIVIVSEKMEKLIDEKVKEIRALKTPKAKGAEEFKTAAIRYFEFMKSLYTGYKNYGKAPSAEEREKVITDVMDIVNKKDDAVKDMQTAQKKYADDNGFKVEN